MNEIISNNQLKTFLQRQIWDNDKYRLNPKLDNLKYCGSQATNPNVPTAIKVIANKKESKFVGVTQCHSPWSCPHCSAKVMAQKAGDIACAIDALATWFKLRPMMITFTLPHISSMSCEETYTILRNTWRRFTKDGNKKQKRKYTLKTTIGETRNKSYDKEYLLTNRKTGQRVWRKTGTKNEFFQGSVGTAGEIREYTVSTSKWATFRDELKIKHSVRVYEFTWGENSWHPHIHALFWTHENNFSKIPQYEPDILDYWWKCAKSEALKLYNQKNPDKKAENQIFVDTLFSEWRKTPNGEHRSLYISKDDNGAIRKISSSMYLCGWGGDAELTASVNIKEAKDGHYTPFQMLELAYKDATQREKWLNLFIEYAQTTFNHRRVEFSTHSGLRQIINRWKKTEQYITAYKKKSQKKSDSGKWKIIYWFTSQQWKQICFLDNYTDNEIRQLILEYAMLENAKDLINDLLQKLEIPLYYPADEYSAQTIKKLLENYEARLYGNCDEACG